MACEVVRLPGGQTAIVCGPRKRIRPCAYCSAPGVVLCDHEIGPGKTCDVPMCRAHAKHVEPDRDYCRLHLKDGWK